MCAVNYRLLKAHQLECLSLMTGQASHHTLEKNRNDSRVNCLHKYALKAAVSPVRAGFWDPPHLNAFEGPPGADCHVDVAAPVGVEALSGSRALGTHSPTGVKNPFFGCA